MKKMKSRLMAALLAAALVPAVSGCAKDTGKDSAPMPGETMAQRGEEPTAEAFYRTMAQAQAKARMDSGDALIILDVRTQAEYDAGHIAGAVLLPNEDIGTDMPAQLPDKAAEILIYCRSGNRSAQAARKLVALGYTAVYDFGGINTWSYGVVTE